MNYHKRFLKQIFFSLDWDKNYDLTLLTNINDLYRIYGMLLKKAKLLIMLLKKAKLVIMLLKKAKLVIMLLKKAKLLIDFLMLNSCIPKRKITSTG